MQQTEYIDTICNTTYNFINTKNTLLTGGEMSQWDKLLKRILSLSKDMRFEELKKVLEAYGYEMCNPISGSSHYTFRKNHANPITIPKHEPIKKIYVEMVKSVVEAEDEEIKEENQIW